jgi:hypothetical protein
MSELGQRIPDLSDKQLESLHANAVRLSQSGTQAQRLQAESLLPLIGAEMEQRRVARAAASAEARRAATQRRALQHQGMKEKHS